MTDAPKPPKRRRRKIVVAFVLLVLLASVSWWYWPRGDARFVGKWEVHDGQHIETWQLTRNGVLHSEVAPNVIYTYGSMLSRSPYASSWHYDGERFRVGRSGGRFLDPILFDIAEWCSATLGFRPVFPQQRWYKAEWLESGNKIYLDEQGAGVVFLELRRIPE